MDSVERDVRDFVIGNFLFGRQDIPLASDESFIEGGITDSTGVLELVSFLEHRYQIDIQEEDIVPANLDSVDRVVAFVQRKVDASRRAAPVEETW